MQTTLLSYRKEGNKSVVFLPFWVFLYLFIYLLSTVTADQARDGVTEKRLSQPSGGSTHSLTCFLGWYHSFEKLSRKHFSSSLSGCQNFQPLRGPPGGTPSSVETWLDWRKPSQLLLFAVFKESSEQTDWWLTDWSVAQSEWVPERGLFICCFRLCWFESLGHKEHRVNLIYLFTIVFKWNHGVALLHCSQGWKIKIWTLVWCFKGPYITPQRRQTSESLHEGASLCSRQRCLQPTI